MQTYGATGEQLAEGALQAAVLRLDAALTSLDKSLGEALARKGGEDAFADDRARLAADLDASRARERALEQLAAEASAALGRAADEVRAALAAERRGEAEEAGPSDPDVPPAAASEEA